MKSVQYRILSQTIVYMLVTEGFHRKHHVLPNKTDFYA